MNGAPSQPFGTQREAILGERAYGAAGLRIGGAGFGRGEWPTSSARPMPYAAETGGRSERAAVEGPSGVRGGLAKRAAPVDVRLDGGVFAFESHHAPDFRMAVSRHDFLEAFLVVEGAGEFDVGAQTHRCGKGDLIIVPCGAPHLVRDDPGRPLSLYGVCVSPYLYGHLPGADLALRGGRTRLRPAMAAQVRSDLRRLLLEQSSSRPDRAFLMAGLVFQFLGLLTKAVASPREHPSPGACAEAVRRYAAELNERFLEPDHLEAIVTRLGMSRRRFTQLFREVTGTSWLDRLTTLRIGHACRLLRETNRSITGIAFECGFEEVSTFYRAFRQKVGVSPSRWRQGTDA